MEFRIGRAAKHFWEEPVLSGTQGSGTIFFCGCNLKCVYCQNYEISRGRKGVGVSPDQLVKLMLWLQDEGAHNINLVSPSQYAKFLPEVLTKAKKSLTIPIVYNSGGYDRIEDLKRLDGLVDIYLPDYKYADSALAQSYSGRADYPAVAHAAIAEMRRQQPRDKIVNSLMQKGVIVRHLVLPNHTQNSFAVLERIAEIDPRMYVSLMAQYFPTQELAAQKDKYPLLNTRLSQAEYDSVCEHFFEVGLKNGFSQSPLSATKDYVPEFDESLVAELLQKLS